MAKDKTEVNSAENGPVATESSNIGRLVSRLDYPQEVKYGDTSTMLPQRGKREKIDASKLDLSKLPKGITFQPYK